MTNSRRTVIGIDPGLKGAWACYYPDDPEEFYWAWGEMPVIGGNINGQNLVETFEDEQPDLVVIEKVHSMPKQGVASSFKFGCGYGTLIGICAAMRLSYILVTPQQWKKTVLAGLDWKKNKECSVAYVQRKYPKLELPRAKDKRIGVCDAICIAEYGRREG